MNEPTTEAGRALLADMERAVRDWKPMLVADLSVLAIEQEARAALRAELAEAVEGQLIGFDEGVSDPLRNDFNEGREAGLELALDLIRGDRS